MLFSRVAQINTVALQEFHDFLEHKATNIKFVFALEKQSLKQVLEEYDRTKPSLNDGYLTELFYSAMHIFFDCVKLEVRRSFTNWPSLSGCRMWLSVWKSSHSLRFRCCVLSYRVGWV